MTKLLADENVPIEAVKTLKSWGIDIVSIIDFSLGLSDRDVINLSSREDRILVTLTRISVN